MPDSDAICKRDEKDLLLRHTEIRKRLKAFGELGSPVWWVAFKGLNLVVKRRVGNTTHTWEQYYQGR